MAFPKWMYRKNPQSGEFQSTLVSTEEAATQLAADGWNEDPKSHGVDVVPYPCELTPGGQLQHHTGIGKDANGNYAYGPAPTVPGISGATVLR